MTTSSLSEPPALAAAARLDGVDLVQLAARLGTPLHVYSASAIRSRIDQLQSALEGLDALICYAAKANTNIAILQMMGRAGIGADIVSAGELRRCLQAGIPPERIVFSGVGKTADEIAGALTVGIHRFNVESHDELLTLQRLAAEQGVTARAAVRINPDVDARTHAKISTGKAENKFGVSIEEARLLVRRSRAADPRARSMACMCTSARRSCSLEPFRLALQRVAAFRRELVAAGHPIDSIDVGGGLGVCYRAGQDRPVAAADYVARDPRGAGRLFAVACCWSPGAGWWPKPACC